ncbi:unnamed protein product, partial [Brassica oleracea]
EPSSSLVHRARSFPQYPFHPPLLASAVFPLHLPESAARSSPSVASAGREDLGKALRDWNLWGPFFFIVFLGLTLSWSASVKKAKASLDSALLLAFDLTQRTDSVSNKQHNVVLSYTCNFQFHGSLLSCLMSMIRYAINHIVKFTIKCCSHVSYMSKTMVVVATSVFSFPFKIVLSLHFSISGFDVTQSNLNDSPLSI